MTLGVEGNRADWFALRTARAHAALFDRKSVTEADLSAAIQLVLKPRAYEAETVSQPVDLSAPPPESEIGNAEDGPPDRTNVENDYADSFTIRTSSGPLPVEVLKFSKRKTSSQRPGKTIVSPNRLKGRYVRSTTRFAPGSKIAIDATLRAAAPFQVLRSSQSVTKAVTITKSDLRFKTLNRRTGLLFILVVDASGSMAVNRMAQAKGALISLLRQAYLHRDKVCLIAFRGRRADILLHPTRSVERGKRLIDEMPAGGGTPLAAGLVRALDVAKLERARDKATPMLVVFTDGRANVSLDPPNGGEGRVVDIREELQAIGSVLQYERIDSVVIDTRATFISRSEGQELADLLGGRYINMPRVDDSELYELVSSIADEIRP
jgi:magnesium chelatase subunit D